MKIYLSPSDQTGNIVADKEHSEQYHCSQIANATKKYLEMNDYTVKIGDNSEQGTYPQRVKDSNAWGADLHVCIHTNAGGGEGTSMFTYPTSVKDKYVVGIYNEVAALTPTKDRGIQSRSDLYEIVNTVCVCAYLEAEFHDNVSLENWIDENVDNIGKAIARGICKADGKEFICEGNDLYKVQVGAFKSYNNAVKLKDELKQKGYDCFIVNA